MRSLTSGCLALTALIVTTSSAMAQQQGIQLKPGARVRLVSPTLQPNQQIVRIVSAGNDSVAFQSERDPKTQIVALRDISSVDVGLGEQTHARRGALVGFLAGAALGGIVGYASSGKCTDSCFELFSPSESAAILGVLGGVAGSVVGMTFGFLSKSEKWQRVPLNTRLSIVPSRGGAGISISRSF